MAAPTVAQEFAARFGQDAEIVAVAPGRINLIGEHTDYNQGFVFPAAIDRCVQVAGKRTNGPSRLFSQELGFGEPFDASTVAPGQMQGWAAYAAGMAWALREAGKGIMPNIEAAASSDLPIGSGVSSSAAIELAFGLAFAGLAGIEIEGKELARIAQKCENEFVGVKSGIMDQMASALGKAGHAMFLDTRSLDIRYVPIPGGLSIAVCDTKKPRQLADSAYNERRSQCEQASRALGVPALRDATLEQLEQARPKLGELIYRRARHVISENDRCQRFVEALERSDLAAMGELMRRSHASLRDDYEVSCPELDAMAEAANAATGCVGARMTGAGFGGVCVALVESSRIQQFAQEAADGYRAKTAIEPEIIPCQAADGARIVALTL